MSGPHHLRICIPKMFWGDSSATYLGTSVFEPLPENLSRFRGDSSSHSILNSLHRGDGSAGVKLQTWFLWKQSRRQELGLSLGGAWGGRWDWGKGQGGGRTSHLGQRAAAASRRGQDEPQARDDRLTTGPQAREHCLMMGPQARPLPHDRATSARSPPHDGATSAAAASRRGQEEEPPALLSPDRLLGRTARGAARGTERGWRAARPPPFSFPLPP